jgi:UDP-N-acetyl-D-glucosamine dehydrogenase
MRESPAVIIMEMLAAKGAHMAYSDPYVPVFPKMREHYFKLSSIELAPANLSEYDAVVITTAHDAFNFELIKQHARLIIDTRGVYAESSPHIIKA